MIPFFIAPALTTKKFIVAIYGAAFGLFLALTFTAEGATALAVAITALIAAIFTGVVNLITVLQAKSKVEETGKKVEEAAKKTDTLLEKTVEIHALTNSAASRMETALGVAQQEIAGLKALVASMTEATKAQADAVTVASALTPPLPSVGRMPDRAADLATDTNEVVHRVDKKT